MTLEEKRDASRIEHMHDAIARIAIIMGSLEKEDFLILTIIYISFIVQHIDTYQYEVTYE